MAGTPTVGTPNATTGVVTGALNVTDPDGNPLTYTVTTAPAGGKVTVTSTGAYTYTPTQAARLRANLTPGADTNSFTVTASDGQQSVTTTVAGVPVTPAQLTVNPTPITVGASPFTVAISPDGTRAYVVNTGDGTVSVIDTGTNKVVGTPITVGSNPSAVAISPNGTRAYVVNNLGGTVSVIDTASNKVVGNPITVGDQPSAIAITPNGTRAYVTNVGGNSVSVIDTATNTIVGTPITVGASPFAIAISPNGTRAYVANAGDGSVSVIDTAANAVVGSPIAVGSVPYDVAVTPNGTRVYVTNTTSGTVSVIDTATNKVVGAPIAIGDQPVKIKFSRDGSVAYVTKMSAGNVGSISAIDTKTNTVIGTPTPTGQGTTGIALAPNGTRIYVTNYLANTVSVIDFISNNAPTNATATVGTPNASTGVVTGTVTATDPDNDPLTYAAPATTPKGSVSVNATTGAFTYTPTAAARHDASATTATAADKADTFTVTIADGKGGTITKAVTVTVLGKNTAPTGPTASIGTPNATTGVVTGTVKATDAESDSLTYTTPANTTKGKVTLNATTGAFTYTPTQAAREKASAANATAADKQDTFTVTINDAHTGVITQAVTVTITPNKAPINATATVGTPNATTGVVTGTVTATDPDGDPLKYTAPATTTKGSVSVNTTTGAFTYTPTQAAREKAAATGAPAADTQDSFTITIADGRGATLTKAVIVIISPNKAPINATATVGTPNSASGVVAGTVSASDPDGDALTYTAPATTTKGAISVNATSGAFTYTPTDAARHAASATAATAGDKADTFTVTITDAKGASIIKAVTVTVLGKNAAPAGASATVGTPNATTGVVTGTVKATDADGDSLTYTTPANTTKGKVTVNATTGAFTYTPTQAAREKAAAANATAADKADTFTVTINDAHTGGVITQAVTVTITRSKVTTIATVATPGSSLPFYVAGPTANRLYVIDTSDRVLVFDTTTNTFVDTDPSTPVLDGIRIGPSARDGVVTPDGRRLYVANDGASSDDGTVSVIDTANNTLINTIAVGGSPQRIAVSPDGQRLYVADRGGDGSVSVISTATNKVIGAPIPVGKDPAGLVVSPDGKRLYVANRRSNTVSVIDIDPATAANPKVFSPIAVGFGPVSIAVTPDGKHVYVVNDNDFKPGATVSVIDVDRDANSVIDQVPVSRHPFGIAVTPDGARVYVASLSGDALVDVIDTTTNKVIDVVATPDQSFATDVAVRGNLIYVTSYKAGGGSVSVITGAQGTPNRPPTGATATVGTPNASTGVVTGTVSATDPDNDPLKYTTPATTPKGMVSVNATTGAFTYTPTAAARHTASATTATAADKADTFTVTITDGKGGTITKAVTVTVLAKNTAPAGPTATVGTPNATTGVVTGTVKATDPDGDSLTYTTPATTTKGSVSINATTGAFNYTPTQAAREKAAATNATAADKADTFTVTINDAHTPSGVITQAVTVTVSPNKAPTAVADSFTATEDVVLTLTTAQLVGNDTDPEGDALQVNSVNYATNGGATNGTVKLNVDGTVTFTPTANYNGPASFIYFIKDAKGARSATSATVSLTITAVNDAPEGRPDSFTINKDQARTFTVQELVGNDFDPDTGDTLTVIGVGGGSNGKVVRNADGTVTFTPSVGYKGPASFIYKVADQRGAASNSSTDGQVTLTVVESNTNHAPTAVPDGPFSAAEDTAVTLTKDQLVGNDTDPDNGDKATLEVAAITGVTNGKAVKNNDGSVTFTPTADFNGQASFTYTVKDVAGAVSANAAKVSITVTKVNDAPVGVDDGPFTVVKNTPLTLTADQLVGNDTDVDGDTLAVNMVGGATNGTVKRNDDGTVTFIPTPGYTGAASFSYKPKDASGAVSITTRDAVVRLDVQAPAAGVLTLTGFGTDNYKAVDNADPKVRETKTYLSFKTLKANNVEYKLLQEPKDGERCTSSTPCHPDAGTKTVRVKSLDGTKTGVVRMVLRDEAQAPVNSFRIDGTSLKDNITTAGFGPMLLLKTPVQEGKPVFVDLILTVDNVDYKTTVEYRYDKAIYDATPPNREANGPGGQWFVGGQPAPLQGD